jgi:hypothetical protein
MEALKNEHINKYSIGKIFRRKKGLRKPDKKAEMVLNN